MRVKIGFQEQSKGVVADVSIEDDTTTLDAEYNDRLEAEARRLYLKAQSFAEAQSMRKVK